MKKLMNLALYLVYLLFSTAQAGFDWGGNSGQCSGNGTFQQNILQNAVIQVGEIPIGKQDVNIKLTSSEDVDIQIYDKDTGNPIVGWNIGAPIGENPYSNLEYDFGGVHIKYSGYNGDGYNLGHEFIQLSGTLNRGLIMKAYGYKSGYATVNYSWKGTQDCTASGSPAKSGSGTFQQKISNKDIVKVGNLISGLENVYIELISNNDVDIQLYDGNTAIIQWPNGILNGRGYQTTNYAGMKIEWSGYNGDGTGSGHEYIKITGTIDRKLTMKAYGYQAGYATVNYIWSGESLNYQGNSFFYDFPDNMGGVITEYSTSDILKPSNECNLPNNQFASSSIDGISTVKIWTRANSCDRVKLGSNEKNFSSGRYIWNLYIPSMGVGDQASIGAFIYMDDKHELDFECGYGKKETRLGIKINDSHTHVGFLPNNEELLCFMTSQGHPYSTTTVSIPHSKWYKLEIELLENNINLSSNSSNSAYTAKWYINGNLLNTKQLDFNPSNMNFRMYISVENLGFIGDHVPSQENNAYFDFMEFLPVQ